jgi:hypothetical protein
MNSFRVFSECPINVVLLLQVSPRLAMLNATKFVPLIMQTLALHAPDTANTAHRTQFNNFIHAKGKVRLCVCARLLRWFFAGLIFLGVSAKKRGSVSWVGTSDPRVAHSTTARLSRRTNFRSSRVTYCCSSPYRDGYEYCLRFTDRCISGRTLTDWKQ